MAHANIVDNELVDDDQISLRDLPFAERTASQFCDQIQQMASARKYIPSGWHRIFDHALTSLKAVDCPKRNGIEISEIAFGLGAIHFEVYYAPVDKVVRGILNCLCKRSRSTCQDCGCSYGTVYRQKSGQTLCARCHVHAELDIELQRWLGESSANRAYRKRPLIEFYSLPINIQLLIPEDEIRYLRLIRDALEIVYVTPNAVTAHLETLAVMKRFLEK